MNTSPLLNIYYKDAAAIARRENCSLGYGARRTSIHRRLTAYLANRCLAAVLSRATSQRIALPRGSSRNRLKVKSNELHALGNFYAQGHTANTIVHVAAARHPMKL
jgi:alkylhydroperoxidase/carboxymuconolactone decarboxylase family protein YurZ